MASRWERFITEQDAVAVRVRGGWMRAGEMTVPDASFGYLASGGGRQNRGRGRIVPSGQKMTPGSDTWLLRRGEWLLPIRFEIRLPDESSATVRCEVRVELPAQGLAARQFLAGREWPDFVNSTTVGERLCGALRETFGVRLTREAPAVLARLDAVRGESFLREAGQDVLFERGLNLIALSTLAVEPAGYAEVRAEERELRIEEEKLRQQLRFLDIWRRREEGEELARRDVDAMMRHLERQGVLHELEAEAEMSRARRQLVEEEREAEQALEHMLAERDLEKQLAIDARKLQAELEQTQAMNDLLQREGLEGQILRLEDETLKARLLRQLMAREMTPEQIEASAPQNLADELRDLGQSLRCTVDEARDLLEQLRVPATGATREGGAVAGQDVETASAGRTFFVSGKQVSLWTVSATERDRVGVPEVCVDLSAGELGYLRSVRVVAENDGDALLLGAQNGVYWVTLKSDGGIAGKPRAYRFDSHREGRAGTNGAIVVGDYLYASHSARGLARWTVANPYAVAELLFAGDGRAAARGLQLSPDGGAAWFASGSRLLRFDPTRSFVLTGELQGSTDEITAFVTAEAGILAGTRTGRLLWWEFSDTASPVSVARPAERPVSQLATVVRGGRRCFLAAAQSRQVIVFGDDWTQIAAFQSPQPIAWVHAQDCGVVGVSRGRRRAYFWRWDETRAPVMEARVPAEVQGLYLAAARAAAAQVTEGGR